MWVFCNFILPHVRFYSWFRKLIVVTTKEIICMKLKMGQICSQGCLWNQFQHLGWITYVTWWSKDVFIPNFQEILFRFWYECSQIRNFSGIKKNVNWWLKHLSFEVESCFEDVKIWQNGVNFFDWLKDYNHCGGKR